MRHALNILAPGLLQQAWTPAEALGSAVWLWSQSRSHRDFPLHCVQRLLLPAVTNRQFVIASDEVKPVLYAAWAWFNADAERRYLRLPPDCLRPEAWTSGDRLWVTDFIAPFGHARLANCLLRKRLLARYVMRFLCHRGDTRGLRIRTVPGAALGPAELEHWLQTHPVDLGP